MFFLSLLLSLCIDWQNNKTRSGMEWIHFSCKQMDREINRGCTWRPWRLSKETLTRIKTISRMLEMMMQMEDDDGWGPFGSTVHAGLGVYINSSYRENLWRERRQVLAGDTSITLRKRRAAAAAAFPATEQDTRRSRTLNPLPQCFSLHQANSMINTTAVFNTRKSREGASWPKQWSAKRGSGKRSGKFSLLFPKSFAVFLSSSLLVCLLSRLEVLLH